MWVEAITIRIARPAQSPAILEELTAFVQDRCTPGPRNFACYQNLEVENEIALHLAWEERGQPPGKTACGLRIARHCGQYGLVHHSLWKRSTG